MNKIWKLFVNENIKTWKKLSSKILILVILLALIGTLVISKVMEKISDSNKQEYLLSETLDWKKDLEETVKHLEVEVNDPNLDENTKIQLENQLKSYKLAIENNVDIYQNTWKRDIIYEIAELQDTDAKEKIDVLSEALKSDDFSKYIETKKKNAKKELDDKIINQEEYEDKIKILELKEKCEIGKKEDSEYWKRQILTEIENAQKAIRTGFEPENDKVLSVEDKEKKENEILMNIYRLENNIAPTEYAENYRTIFENLAPAFVISMLAILAIVVAGGTISTEVSTRTIKFWALTPNKRWKILTAKILSVLFYVIVITLVMSILTVIFANIFFDETGETYLYVKDGQVRQIGNTLYMIEIYFAKIIPVIVFALFAIMLSVVTRNTSGAVSFSVAIYMGNTLFMQIINQFIKQEWIKFVPFNNLNIASKIFPNATNIMGISLENFATSTSLGFSLSVLLVCIVLMLVTMYDSFNKRDII